jgi:hypothetical protein
MSWEVPLAHPLLISYEVKGYLSKVLLLLRYYSRLSSLPFSCLFAHPAPPRGFYSGWFYLLLCSFSLCLIRQQQLPEDCQQKTFLTLLERKIQATKLLPSTLLPSTMRLTSTASCTQAGYCVKGRCPPLTMIPSKESACDTKGV